MSQTITSLPSYRSLPASAKLFMKLIARVRVGHFQVITPEGQSLSFGELHQPLDATLQIKDWRACGRIIRAGDIGFAESYEADWIDSPNLTALLRLAIRNESVLDRVVSGGRLTTLWYRLKHVLRPNTRKGSQRNIHAHYDIGNDFYNLWLDKSLTYSSAIFEGDYSQLLQQAQTRKYQRIIDELGLKSGDKVLEIGCGWGGFAEHAAKLDIHVHGVTISQAQLEVAQKRIAENKLQYLAQLELRDYRDLQGEYDAIVSIEMFEAVGERFWPEFFKIVSDRLKTNGKALVQSITIDERNFERYRSNTDFIQQYIFPGGMLPSPERFCAKAIQANFKVLDQYAFGKDYAETLRRWSQKFQEENHAITRQGFDERFMRIWQLYFAYCEAGFDEEKTNVFQFLLQKS